MARKMVRENLEEMTDYFFVDMPVFASEVEMLKSGNMIDEHGNPLVSGIYSCLDRWLTLGLAGIRGDVGWGEGGFPH